MAGTQTGLLIAFGGAITSGTPLVQGRTYDWEDWWHPMWGMWGAWGLGMMLIVMLFWGLAIVGIVLGIRWLITQGKASRPDAAVEILRQRYARGEINKDEFDAKKRDLGA